MGGTEVPPICFFPVTAPGAYASHACERYVHVPTPRGGRLCVPLIGYSGHLGMRVPATVATVAPYCVSSPDGFPIALCTCGPDLHSSAVWLLSGVTRLAVRFVAVPNVRRGRTNRCVGP